MEKRFLKFEWGGRHFTLQKFKCVFFTTYIKVKNGYIDIIIWWSGLVEVELVLKKWGRSFGAVIPMQSVKELGLKENDHILASLSKDKTPMQLTFGSLKMKRSTAQLLAESDRVAWDE